MELWHPSYEITDPSMVDPDRPINWDDALCDELVSFWMVLPSTKGDRSWFDLTGRNHATLRSDPVWTGPNGRPGGFGAISLSNSGSNDHVDFATANDYAGEFTAMAMVFPVAFSTSIFSVFAKGTANDQDTLYFSTATIVLRPAGSNLSATTDPDFVEGEWQHAAWTRDASDLFEGYRNGQKVGERASSSGTLTIGGLGRSQNIGCNGLIDCVMEFSSHKSAGQIAAIYDDIRLGCPRMLNWQRRTITRFFGGASFTASAALTTAAATMAASATFAPGTKTATAALTLGAATMAASATFDAGTFTATAAVSTAAATMTASATFAPGTKTATAALTTAAATTAASATFDAGTFTATAALSTAAATMAAAATFAVDSFQATAALTTAAATMAASATFAPGTFTATATLSTAAATMAASATFDAGTFTATAALTVAAATMAASGLVATPGAGLYTAVANLVTSAATMNAAGSVDGPTLGPATINYRATGGRPWFAAEGGRLRYRASGGRLWFKAKGAS